MAKANSPWLSAGASHSELESVSSLSLLHSIYGSQVSQVLLASDDSLVEDAKWTQDNATSRRRPKSSPAATRLERETLRQISSKYKTSGSVQDYQGLVRPSTARVRPSTARVSDHSRSSIQEIPRSALQCRGSLSLLLDAESESDIPRTSIHTTNPVGKIIYFMDCMILLQVPLTRVPEYVNFWQGKPLLKREHSKPIQPRKAWHRPKSDYGSRFLAHKNESNALDTVLEARDGSTTSSSEERIEDLSKSHARAAQSDTTLLSDAGGHSGKGVGTKWRDGNLHLENGKNTSGLRGKDARGNWTAMRPAANMWAQRSQVYSTVESTSTLLLHVYIHYTQKVRIRRDSNADSSHGDGYDNFFHKVNIMQSPLHYTVTHPTIAGQTNNVSLAGSWRKWLKQHPI